MCGVDENLDLAEVYWKEYVGVAEEYKLSAEIVNGLINLGVTYYN